MSIFLVPSSRIPLVTLLQFTELTLVVFCCNVQPVEGEYQKYSDGGGAGGGE